MENKTAEEVLKLNGLDFPVGIGMKDYNLVIKSMKEYARQVAIEVRQECADKAKVKEEWNLEYDDREKWESVVDEDSILKVEIEQFLK